METKPTNRIFQSLRSSPLKVALTYVAAATLWIITSSYLLPQTVTNPELQGIFEISKGLLFVLVTGWLLYVMLRSWIPEGRQQDDHAIFEFKPWGKVRILPAAFALILFLPLLVILIYLLEAPVLEKEGMTRLQGKARIMAIHIESWLSERESDAEVLYHNRTLSEIVNSLQRTGSARSRDIVKEYLQEVHKSYDYESIVLLDKNNTPLLALGEHTNIPELTRALITEAQRDGKIKHNHQFMLEDEHLHTDYVVPLSASQRSSSRPYAFIIMRAKLNETLMRTTQTQSDSQSLDNILLIHINQDGLVAVDTATGKLHHTRDKQQLQEHLPAVIALRSGKSGSLVTTDYRNKSVLTVWQQIAGTEWFVLAKVDRDIILSPLWGTLGWVVLVGGFLIAAIIALLHILWKRQQYYQRLERIAQRTQTDKLLKHFFDIPFVGMAIWSAKDGHWLRFNDRLCDMLGFSRERLQNMRWEELAEPDDLPKEKHALEQIIKGKSNSYTVEMRLRRIDGSNIHTNINVYCVRDRSNKPDILVAIIQDISAYRRTIEALRESEERFHTIFDGVLDGIVMAERDSGAFITGNTAFCDMLGYTAEEIAGMSFRDIHPQEVLARAENEFFRIADGKIHSSLNVPVLRKDGSVFFADIKGNNVTISGHEYVIGIFRDITQRKENENKLQRLSQFYAALSQCNEAIIRSSNETELLQDICRIAVQITDISASWIGLIDNEDKQLRQIAGFGPGNEEVAASAINLRNGNDKNNNPARRAINENHAIWIQNFPDEISAQQCRTIADNYGWYSAAALPLHRQGSIIGVLTLYADGENAFDEDVQKLLNEMVGDISFALSNFVLEEQRHASEESLAESEQRFRGLVEQSLAGIYIIQDDKYVYANPRLAEILGFSSYEEITGHQTAEFIIPQDRDRVLGQIHDLLQGKREHLIYEAKVRRVDGALVDIGVHGALASHNGRPAVIGLVQDVTDKKRAETQLNSYVEKLQSSLMQTVEVATMLSEMRDPYTAGHERRVAEIAVAIGREMGLEEQELEGLRVAGYLHDIGKINIPSEILAKPGKLTELEYEIIKGHPKSGYNVLKDVDFPWPVAQVALQHHERINGSGYPQGLKGDEILLQARITAVADVVEAMGSHRPYRPGLGIEPALDEIERGKGTLYDLQVADACLCLFREKGYSLPA